MANPGFEDRALRFEISVLKNNEITVLDAMQKSVGTSILAGR